MRPVKELFADELDDGLWIDPFAGYNSPAAITNDLNPETPALCHMDAVEFLRGFAACSVDGVIIDPPYSPRQVSDCYKGFGKNVTSRDTQGRPLSLVRKDVARIVRPGGKVICFGWNSNGIGRAFGFEMVRVLLITHSVIVNDTIVTVEVKRI